MWDMASNTFQTRNGDQSIRRVKYGDGVDDFESGERLNAKADEIFVKYKNLLAIAKKRQISM
jgi:hypothetical protein